MDKNIYEKTRWENIYRNKKKKNYIIRFNTPIQTSISKDERGNPILDAETAKKIRDNQIIANSKKIQIKHKETIDDLWDRYIENCKYIKKQAYNTIKRKEKAYTRYVKDKISIALNKIDKEYWAKFIDQLDCSDKQKNHLIKILKAFCNWCMEEDIIISNEISKIKKYKETKKEMKFWTTDEIRRFFKNIDKIINTCSDKNQVMYALMIKTFVMIGFSLGDRVGETRALTFDCINREKMSIIISHSINYDRKSEDFLSDTKNYHSQREIFITQKLVEQIDIYKDFLINVMKCPVKDNFLLFFNYSTNKPYTDTNIRKHFYKFCETCEVSKIRMYDLRHTYVATMMSEGKELYQISSRIGHSNYSTTVNKYGHLSTEIRKEIANSTDKYL